MNKMLTFVIVGVLLLAAVILAVVLASSQAEDTTNDSAGHSSSSTTSQNTEAKTAVQTTEVEIEDYAYGPQTIKIKVGETVTWTNKDGVRHDVTADESSNIAPSSELLDKGESYSFKFTKAGTYTYYCQPHPYMKGTVIVE